VKASRLFAGYDHEMQTKRIASHFNISINFYRSLDFNPEKAAAAKENAGAEKKNPGVGLGNSLFGERDLNSFKDGEAAYYQLMQDIIALQTTSAKLVMKDAPVKKMFVDGGFSKNPIYMNMLATSFPDIEVYGATIAQSTSLGAALAIHKHWNASPIPENLVVLKKFS
jgi:L-fuculokinase